MSFWTIFFSFTTLTTQNVKILKKWKNTPGDIIILHASTINKKSCDTWFLRYEAWQTGFFLKLDHFLLFYQPNNFWKNVKKHLEILSFYMCTISENHVMYGSWDIECNRQNFLSLRTILCPVTPLTPQKIKNFEIMKKTPGNTITLVHHKLQSYDVWFLRYEVQQTEFCVILGHFLSFYRQPKKLKFWKK